MDPIDDHCLCMTRRHFFGRNAAGIGTGGPGLAARARPDG